MPFDYVIIGFLIFGFISGMHRGLWNEISHFIILTASFAIILFGYNELINLFNLFIPMTNLYSKFVTIFDFLNIKLEYLNFVICCLSPVLLLDFIVTKIVYMIFFKEKKNKIKDTKKHKKLFGGLVGLLSGLVISMIIMIVFNGLVELNFSGPISSVLIEYVPNLKDIIVYASQGGSVVE